MEVLLRTPATVLRIGVLYRPPPSTENGLTATMFFNEFPILLERLAVASGHLLVAGDFNFHVDDRTDIFSSPACNVNDLCDQYDSELSKVVDVYAPLKTRFVISCPSALWYGEEIAAEKCKRRKLEKRWPKSGTEADKLQYSDQCSRVCKLLKSSKMSYYASLINENKSDSKVLFNTIDHMLHCKPQNHYPSCGSPKELRDKFADFFCDKIVTIRHQLDMLSTTEAPAFPLIDDAIITCELSEFSPTSKDELSGLVKKITAKSCSLDPVPASLLRYCIDDILPIIKSV
ncbi:hypothetical protein P5673_029990, partial [Acropora cervicornis]